MDIKIGNTTRNLVFRAGAGSNPAVVLCKNGGSFGPPVGTVTEVGNGLYMVAANAADADTPGSLWLLADFGSGSAPVVEFDVVAYDPDNATSLGLSRLDQTVGSRSTYAGGAVASVTGAVGSVGAGGITAASFAAAAITSTVAPNLDAAVTSRLAPTVAGRTLDVSGGGEAGIDWANIGNNTTAVNLSGTAVKAVADGVTVASLASDSVNAAAISTDAGAELAAAVWAAATRTLTSGANIVLAKGTGVTGFNDPSAAQAAAAVFGTQVETGVTFAQVCEVMGSALGGTVTLNGSTYAALGNPGTTRIQATTDGAGDRTVTLSL